VSINSLDDQGGTLSHHVSATAIDCSGISPLRKKRVGTILIVCRTRIWNRL